MTAPAPTTHDQPPQTGDTARGQADYSGPVDGMIHRLDQAIGETGQDPNAHITPEMARVLGSRPLIYAGIDQSFDARERANDAAERRIREDLNNTPEGRFQWLRKTVKNIWKSSLESHYRREYKREALDDIVNKEDIYSQTQLTKEQAQDAQLATFEAFTTTWTEDTEHREAGEWRVKHGEDHAFTQGIKDLVKRYLTGELNEETLREEQNRFYAEYRKENENADSVLGEGKVRIDNMLRLAKEAGDTVDGMLGVASAIKGSQEHVASIAFVLNNMKVVTGESRSGVRTQTKYDRVERWIDKTQNNKVGRFIGPTTLSVAASVLSYAWKGGVAKAVATTGAIGAGAAGFAFLKERKRVKEERTIHSREMAMGQQYEVGSNRREEMEATRYATVEASDLTDSISSFFSGEDKVSSGDKATLEALLTAVATAETLIKKSDRERVDLISFSSEATTRERLDLNLARAEAKVRLRKRLNEGGAELFSEMAEGEDVTLELLLEKFSIPTEERLRQDKTTKDEAFKKLRRRRALKAATKAGFSGIVIGGIAGEAIAAIPGNGQSGLVEQLWHADSPSAGGHLTLAHSLVEKIAGHDLSQGPAGNYSSFNYAGHGNIQLDGGHSLITHNGSIDIADKTGHVIPELTGLKVDGQGHLSDAARTALTNHGFAVSDLPSHTETVPSPQASTTSVTEFMNQPNNGTTHVTRDFWYDNNTPRIFEGNEQGLHLGGVNGSGVTADGQYEYSIATMQEGGSFHGDQLAHLQQLEQQGRLKLAVSATEGSQTRVFMVDAHVVNGHVAFDIDPKTAPGSLYSVQNGQLQFHGAYAEVVETGNQDPSGVLHMRPIATATGDHTASTITTAGAPRPTEFASYRITTGSHDVVTDTSPVIPVMTRRPLENVRPREQQPEAPGLPGLEQAPERLAIERAPESQTQSGTDHPLALTGPEVPPVSPDDSATLPVTPPGETQQQPTGEMPHAPDRGVEKTGKDAMPELQTDGAVELGKALEWNYNLMKDKDPEYARRITEILENEKSLEKLAVDTDVILPVVVHPTRDVDTIYKTLKNYGERSLRGNDTPRLLLNVVATADQGLVNDYDNAARTMEAIKRIESEYPELKLSYFTTTATMFGETEQQSGGYSGRTLEEVADENLYQVTMFAAQKAIQNGSRQGDKDILVLRRPLNADTVWGDEGRMLKAMQNNPDKDIFYGGVQWDRPDMFEDATSTAFLMQFLNTATTVSAWTNGSFKPLLAANMGYRLSTIGAVGAGGHYTDRSADAAARTYDLAIGERFAAARNPSRVQSSGVSGASDSTTSPKKRITEFVKKTQIRLDPRPFENAVQRGGSVTDAIFDIGRGITNTPPVSGSDASFDEAAHEKPNSALSRIEGGISDIINNLHMTEKEYRSTLALLFPRSDMYVVTQRSDGRRVFRMSNKARGKAKSGRNWLLDDLRNNPAYRRT